MWGAIAGAVIGLGTSIAGGIMNANAARKQRRYLNQKLKENSNWYNRRYNEDSTQRADAQRILRKTEDAIRERNRAALGRQRVMGATEEGVAATKAANAQMMADAISQIAADGAARKDAIEEQYMARKDSLEAQKVGLGVQQQANVAQAVKGVGSAVGNALSAIDSSTDMGTTATTTSTADVATTAPDTTIAVPTPGGAVDSPTMTDGKMNLNMWDDMDNRKYSA